MKRIAMLFACLVFAGFQLLQAQSVTITGTVTSKEDGTSLPGVSVVVKGTTMGTLTNFEGKFSISVPQNTTALIFSFVGLKTQDIPIEGKTVIDVVMETDVVGIDEVIVTALNITRDKKSLGYSIQDVKGDELATAREGNVINSLQGRIAGVSINNSSGSVSSSSRIVIRGNNSLTGDNQPLFVVDGVPISNTYNTTGAQGGIDYGNAASDINPNDVESFSVLKGASAAALYGSRAANGVILITTKSGKKTKGLGITVENNTTFENVLVMPKYQNEYGQGYYGEFEYVDGNGGGTNDNVDESWGPKLDGRLIGQYSSPYDPLTGIRTPTPWIAHPDNMKAFFDTGLSSATSISLAGSSDKSSVRVGITHSKSSGVIPYTDLTKNNLSVNASTNLSEKFTVNAAANYISNQSDNIPSGGYTSANILQQSSWHGTQVDYADLRNRWQEIDPQSGRPFNWNHSYHDNPFWTLHKNTNSRGRDRLIGNVTMQYFFTDWLNLRASVGTDFYTEERMERRAIGSNDWPKGTFNANTITASETNANVLLTFNKNILESLSFTATAGANYMHHNYRDQSINVAELIVADVYSVSNANVTPTTSLYFGKDEIQSAFGSASFGFKDYLFLDFTLRNDWSSTLPKANRSFMYPSASLGFVFTDALNLQSNALSYGKLRASWAQVGAPADRYMLQGTYSAASPFFSQPALTYTDNIPPPNLKAELTTSQEVGLEMKFFQNRIGLDLSLYSDKTENQILNIPVSRSTGFNQKTINAGTIANKGVEVMLNLTPVKKGDFTWDITLNWAQNKNEVVKLAKGMKFFNLPGGNTWGVYIQARPGEPYGSMYSRELARENYTRDADGNVIANSGRLLIDPATGNHVRTPENVITGNITPDWTGGVRNSFTYKKVNFSFLIDARHGGDMFSVTDWFGNYAGVLSSTVGTNANGKEYRDPVADGGGYLVKGIYGTILTDGTVQYLDAHGNDSATPVENTTYMEGQDYFEGYWGKPSLSIFDCSYVKLREVVLGYTFEQNFVKKLGIQSVNLSFVGRNLWIIHKNMPNIDPENSFDAGNVQGLESNSLPSTRSLGFNLRITL